MSPGKILPKIIPAIGGAAAVGYGLGPAQLLFGPPLVVLGLGGVVLGVTSVLLYRILEPLLRPEAVDPETPRGPVRIRELEHEKQAVLKAIREIEFDYQMRKIAEPDYRELSQRYRARAMRLMRELEAGDDYRTLIEQELKARMSVPAEKK